MKTIHSELDFFNKKDRRKEEGGGRGKEEEKEEKICWCYICNKEGAKQNGKAWKEVDL
jgi:hypothetical protein